MKTMIKSVIISFIFCFIFVMPLSLSADPPGMPGNHGANGDVPGGGAPIGAGVAMLISMSVAYGAKKQFSWKNVE